MTDQLPERTYGIYLSNLYAVTRQGDSILVRELRGDLPTVSVEGAEADRFESQVNSFNTELVTDLYLSSYFDAEGANLRGSLEELKR